MIVFIYKYFICVIYFNSYIFQQIVIIIVGFVS